MKKFSQIILISLIFIIGTELHADSVDLYGFKPASLIVRDELPSFELKKPLRQDKENVFVTILAEIDKKGKLKSLKSKDEKDSLFLEYVTSYIKKLKFKPAKLHNKKIKSLLPIEVDFCKSRYSPIFYFPLLNDTLVADFDLFEYAVQLNNNQLAQVLSFPSYFSDVKVDDSVFRYPFVIEKLLYEKGELVAIENEMSTHDQFVSQIESAILYSQIQLPRIEKTDFSEELYLMVSFFPHLSYPVSIYDMNTVDSSNLLHQYRVRIVSRFSQILAEPIPKRISSDRFTRNIFGSLLRIPIDVYIRINRKGDAGVLRVGSSNKKIAKSINKMVSKIKFYPAINQKNELVVFTGYLRIEPLDTLNIRISYLWLD